MACKTAEPDAVKSDKKDISNLAVEGLPGANIVFDQSISTYSVTVPAGTNVSALNVTFSLPQGATSRPESGSIQDFRNPVNYTVTAEDKSSRTYIVRVVVQAAPKATEKQITAFSFEAFNPVVQATIDQTTKKITATLPANANLSALTPTITVSAKATVSPTSGVTQNFVNPVNYTVTAEDGSTQVYEVKVDKATPQTNMVHDGNKKVIPVGGNSWVISPTGGVEFVSNEGLENWQNAQTTLTTYVRVAQAGSLKVSVGLRVPNGESRFAVTIAGKTVQFTAKGTEQIEYMVDEWTIANAGYVRIDLQGLSKSGTLFGLITNVAVSGTSVAGQVSYVPNNNDNYFHWGRRGPSVHLWYTIPTQEDVEWFYNEVTVPANSDVIGSYYMANGFDGGYFGMQVNSTTERRILFSIWSPFQTDDPTKIPEDQKVKLLKKGSEVVSGEFGNEGSGGQSFLRYNWKAGNTYKFLVRARPAMNNYTDFSAYFFAPEEGTWRLIASFSRPKTNTYLKGLYSFLENFNPNTGNLERSAYYGNQWAFTKGGNRFEVSRVTFSADETASRGYRMDYSGGVLNGRFFLRNCGFFNDFTQISTSFSRGATGTPPIIDFASLP
ncbi:hypothetical protein GCM10023189_39180 [Nibrella saemangeumensis]|uniref:DUF5077 domain-containing protein n=1 Tax=Nibrella saemangeumensis TaxID=1084526 RepID=A0ABP8NBE5_9BACT